MKIDYMQLEFIDIKLRKLLKDFEEQYAIIYREEPTITSLYRMTGTGVHTTLPLRGTDIRCRDDMRGEYMEAHMNSRHKYDHKRPDMKVCMYHDTGLGKHLHFQVHPNTKLLRP